VRGLYSSFFGGWAGAGLLFLRLVVGGTLIAQGFAYLHELQRSGIGTWTVCLLALSSGSALLVGFLTPVAGTMAVLASVGVTFLNHSAPNWNFFNDRLNFDTIITALAVALLGPGAFSLDARLFGRRRIIIPRRSPSRPSD
jgi:uncharacterized membrane protein YphA (DoxX/SURF4 family)